MNVGFDESTFTSQTEPSAKSKWRNYGPAGQYTGNTFRDPMEPKSNAKAYVEPVTNGHPLFSKSNTFGIAPEDLEYELTPDEEAEVEALESARVANLAPPEAPRPAHAELPSSANQAQTKNAGPNSESSDPSLSRLEQQRSLLTKHKPKKSSGLSQVETARSRSSSPPRGQSTSRTVLAEADNEVPSLSEDNDNTSDSSTSPPLPSSHLLAPKLPLDNTVKGPDGLTDYTREHQFDDWARNLDWPAPQSYVDAGVCSPFIDELLRKKITKEDEEVTRRWWEKEFRDVDSAIEEAKRKGLMLELVSGEDVDGEMVS
jgi:hypothetical protein